MTEYYGVAPFDGEDRFRYLQALEVDDSCLECHGEPVGELDQFGYEKEGMQVGDIGGAVSITEPMDISPTACARAYCSRCSWCCSCSCWPAWASTSP